MKRYIKTSTFTSSNRYKKYPKVLSSKFIKSEYENLRPFIVRYGWDNGDAENGPDPGWDEDLVYAKNERDAERRWEEDNEFDLPSNYEGCFAQRVTEEELEEWKKSRELSEDELADIEYWSKMDTPYDLSEDHYNFLSDLAYLTKEFTENDFRNLKEDMAIAHQLDNYMYQSMVAQEQGDDRKLQRLGRVVAKFLKENRRSVNSATFVGEPDPGGYGEGRIRFLNNIHHWKDAYEKFIEIVNKYSPDSKKIETEITKLYSRYKGNKYFDEAYRRWTEN